jgi:hypothetical protein
VQPDGKPTGGCAKPGGNDIDWYTLLARVDDINRLKCPRCVGQRRMIAVITEPEPIRATLGSVCLPSNCPRLPGQGTSCRVDASVCSVSRAHDHHAVVDAVDSA